MQGGKVDLRSREERDHVASSGGEGAPVSPRESRSLGLHRRRPEVMRGSSWGALEGLQEDTYPSSLITVLSKPKQRSL